MANDPIEARRQELHEKLCTILGSRNVYFQPPENIKIPNRAIVYQLSNISTRSADDKNYIKRNRYQVIFMTPDAGDTLYHQIIDQFESCSFDRYYRFDNLNHYALDLYY